MCFDICLEGKKNETAGLYPTFLSLHYSGQIMIKIIIKTITQIWDKATNATEDNMKLERWS